MQLQYTNNAIFICQPSGEISLKDESMIQAFSERYAVHQDLVEKYLHHLAYLQMMKQKRERERKEKAERESKLGYDDLDWEKLMSEGLLRKQKVSILNLYIERHSLTTEKKLAKKRKLDLVSAHIQNLSAALGSVSSINDTTVKNQTTVLCRK